MGGRKRNRLGERNGGFRAAVSYFPTRCDARAGISGRPNESAGLLDRHRKRCLGGPHYVEGQLRDRWWERGFTARCDARAGGRRRPSESVGLFGHPRRSPRRGRTGIDCGNLVLIPPAETTRFLQSRQRPGRRSLGLHLPINAKHRGGPVRELLSRLDITTVLVRGAESCVEAVWARPFCGSTGVWA